MLIPVIVIIALTATGEIIKLSIRVEAKDIVIKDFNNKELPLDETYFLDLVGQDYLEIVVQVIPTISYNLNVIFRSTEESEGAVRVERITGTPFYRIFPSGAGICDLLVIAENNEEVKKTIHFYITTNQLSERADSLIVLTEDNKESGGEALNLGEVYNLTASARLFLDCYPVESIGSNDILWTSENEAIVSVDQNGYIYPQGLGMTTVAATVVDKANKSHAFSVNISTLNAVAKVSEIYLAQENINEDYIYNNILLKKDCTVQENESGFDIYNTDGEWMQTITLNKVNINDIAILNKDYLDTVFIGTGGQQVEVDYLDYSLRGGLQGVSFASSNKNIAIVSESGRVTPLHQGDVTISVYLDGKLLDYKDIKVSARAATFRLTKDNQSNKVGIKQDYVWAYNWIKYDEDGKSVLDKSFSNELLYSRLTDQTTNVYKGLKYSNNSATHIEGDNKNAPLKNISLFWSVDNPEYAEINQKGDLTFFEAVCGNKVAAYAYELVNGVKTRSSRSYTFKFVEDDTAINVDTLAELRGINEGYALGTVLHNNVTIDPNNPAYSPYYAVGKSQLSIRASIYGNGKIMYGKKGQTYDCLMEIRLQNQYIDYTKDNIDRQLRPIVIENLEIDGWDMMESEEATHTNLIQDLIKVKYYTQHQKQYFHYQRGEYLEEPESLRDLRLNNTVVKFRYCYIHNAVKGINFLEMSNAAVEGTIFANMSLSAMNFEQRYSNLASLIIDRVVIRDTAGIGISSILYDDNYKMSSQANPPARIIIKNFFDAYTWAETDSFGVLGKVFPRENLNSLPSSVNADAVYAMIEVALRDMMKQIVEQNGLTLTYNGKKYAHLAILSLGLWAESDPNRIKDETGVYKKLTFKLNKKTTFKTDALPIPFTVSLLETMLGTETLTQRSVVLSYDITKGDILLLPDTPCPSNTALYQRLQGK